MSQQSQNRSCRKALHLAAIGSLALLGATSPTLATLISYTATSDGRLPNNVHSPDNAVGFPNSSSGTGTQGGVSWDFDNITSPSNPTGAWYMNTKDATTAGNSSFNRTDGVASGTSDRYVTSILRVTSLSADYIVFDFVVGGGGNHGATQVRLNTGDDHAVGGSGPNADLVEAYDYNANAVLISAPADFANFHQYTLPRRNSSSAYQLYIDSQLVGSAPITSFSDASSGDKEQYFPSTGNLGLADFDVQYYAFDDSTILFTAIPEPTSLGLLAMGSLLMLRRRAK